VWVKKFLCELIVDNFSNTISVWQCDDDDVDDDDSKSNSNTCVKMSPILFF